MKNVKRWFLGAVGLTILFSMLLIIPYSRAMIVMGGVTQIEKIKKHNAFDLEIPVKGLDWFPEMIWFDASDEFNRIYGTNLSLMVLYSYGNFHEGTSLIFDKTSPYYASFFGAYVIKDSSYPESVGELALIPTYDYENLILRDLGDPNYKGAFQYEISTVEEGVQYMNSKDWEKCDIEIQTHGLWHQKDQFLSHYIQFGIPKENADFNETANFENVNLKGRLYYKRIDEDYTLVLYIIAHDIQLLEDTDRELLSKSKFKIIQ